jgi:hypothetical protein
MVEEVGLTERVVLLDDKLGGWCEAAVERLGLRGRSWVLSLVAGVQESCMR